MDKNKKYKKNLYLDKLLYADVDKFTSDMGLKLRRKISKYYLKLARKIVKKDIVVEGYPELDKDKPYIFASSHSFNDDIISALLTIDRNAYLLYGSTQQLQYNKESYALWVNGMIPVDILDKKSRAQSFDKMKRVINSGTSVLMFPEGSWNVTENKPINRLFRGVYNLSKETGVEVVPIASFREYGKEKIYINVSKPISAKNKTEQEFLEELRDTMATMRYNQIEKYSTPIVRKDLSKDARIEFLEDRREEVLYLPWIEDAWEEEYKTLKSKDYPTEEEVWSFVDNIELTPQNAKDFAKIKVKRKDEQKYNLINFLHKTWDKKDTKDYWDK